GSVKESKSITSIETMSQLYADKLIEAVPVGPYTLAGWSMGGFLALETAARLAKMGLLPHNSIGLGKMGMWATRAPQWLHQHHKQKHEA
ncbi:hypothetical protein SARC_16404, partial [Sphaeroforma arctica JP610]